MTIKSAVSTSTVLLAAISSILAQNMSAAPPYACSALDLNVPASEKFGLGTNFGGWLVLEPW